MEDKIALHRKLCQALADVQSGNSKKTVPIFKESMTTYPGLTKKLVDRWGELISCGKKCNEGNSICCDRRLTCKKGEHGSGRLGKWTFNAIGRNFIIPAKRSIDNYKMNMNTRTLLYSEP